MAISADSAEQGRKLIARLGLRFPLLADPELKVIGAYRLVQKGKDASVPAVFIVDRMGRIIYRQIGESITDRASVKQLLARLGAN